MFDISSCIKLLVTAFLLFISYNMLLFLHSRALFEDIHAKQDLQEVVEALGKPIDIYTCGSALTTAQMPYADSLCQNNATKVYAFKMCLVEFICKGWNSVAFDYSDKVVFKYSFAAPFPFMPVSQVIVP
jgi:hypothetical protein